MTSQTKRPYDRTSYILVVDDDNTLLKFFKIHLNKFFSRVIVVKNAKEAVATLKEKEIDMVITDIRMPRVDGFQLMNKVRRHDPSIPVLMVSGALLTPEQQEMAQKADGYLRKPFTVDQLHSFIDNGLDIRENLAKLGTFLKDRKHIRDLLDGKSTLKKLVEDENQEEAEELIGKIKSAG